MKHHLHQLVDIAKLKSFLKTVKFPTNEDQLEKAAREARTDTNVIDFLESLDDGLSFQKPEEVITQAEEVNILREEEAEAEPEEFAIDEY